MIELLWNAPVSEGRMAHYLAALGVASGQTVVDVGCGCGEVLIRLHKSFGIAGLGFDVSPDHVAEARRRAAAGGADDKLRFQVADAKNWTPPESEYDAALCLGASHAVGDGPSAYATAVARLALAVKPGGRLLIAEGYMRRPAAPEYRRLLGDSMPDSMTHASNVAVGINAGLTPLGAWSSSRAEWDDFEWSYQRVVERAAADRPNDTQAVEKLGSRREWIEAYLAWGRDTLGYGTYLFGKPGP